MTVSEYLVALAQNNFPQKVFCTWLDVNHPISQPQKNNEIANKKLEHHFSFLEGIFLQVTIGIVGLFAALIATIVFIRMPNTDKLIFLPSALVFQLGAFYLQLFAFQTKLTSFLNAKKDLELIVPDLNLDQPTDACQIVFDRHMVSLAEAILNLEKCLDRGPEVDSNLQRFRANMNDLQIKSTPFNFKVRSREWSEYFNQARKKFDIGTEVSSSDK